MGSSPGFVSTPCDSDLSAPPFSDSLSLRLRVYSPLTSPQRVTRWLILQKARGQSRDLPLLVSTRFQILFHSGYPGSFHLSLTVLVHYRSPEVFSLGEWTPQLPTGLACPVVLKDTARVQPLSFTGVSPSSPSRSSTVQLEAGFVTLWNHRSGSCCALQPLRCNGCDLSHNASLGFSPFARHYSGNHFFSSRY